MKCIFRNLLLGLFLLSVVLLGFKTVNAEVDPFSVIVLPDTQLYSQDHPEIFCKQTSWIVENLSKSNIVFVSHLGDIVNKGSESMKQWDNASDCMKKLDGKVPYGIIPGNHDFEKKGYSDSGFATYDKYFPVSRYAGNQWYKGNFRNNQNSYQALKINGQDIVFLNLEPEPSNKALEWAQKIVNENKDAYIILTTHKYLRANKAKRNDTLEFNDSKDPNYTGNSGEDIWNKLVKQNCAIKMVWSGHYGEVQGDKEGENKLSSKNSCGEIVNQTVQDYQGRNNGGNGILRIYEFDQEKEVVNVSTYSPLTGKYENDENSKFTLQLNKGDIAGNVVVIDETDNSTTTVENGSQEDDKKEKDVQTIEILSPVAGESFVRGKIIPFSWKQSKNTKNLEISLLNEESEKVYTMKRYDGWGINKKIFSKTVTSKLEPGEYGLLICDTTNEKDPTCDLQASFTLTEESVDVVKNKEEKVQKIEIKSPNGGEELYRGENINYNYKLAKNTENLLVQLVEVDKNTVEYTAKRYDGWGDNRKIISKTDTKKVPTGIYKLRICDTTTRVPICDESDKSFLIVDNLDKSPISTTTAPSIKVLSPNGGETLVMGTRYTIKFKPSLFGNSTGGVTLQLYKYVDGKDNPYMYVKDIKKKLMGETEFNWEVPTDLERGIYVIYAKYGNLINGKEVIDMSDKPFVITLNDVRPLVDSIKVINPVGGEVYKKGTAINVLWDVVGLKDEKVKIELLEVETQDKTLLGKDAASLKSYSKVIPATLKSGLYKVVISSLDSSVSAKSNGTITIKDKNETLDSTYGDSQEQEPRTETRNEETNTNATTNTGTNNPIIYGIDACKNLDGFQTKVPTGYTNVDVKTSGNCRLIDLCTNLDGNQGSVPSGYDKVGDATVAGICRKVETTSNKSPSAPVISGKTSGYNETSYTFSFKATDPEGDRIRYAIDWNQDGEVDARTPSEGYVNSGIVQTASKKWPNPGIKKFNVRTADENGNVSSWQTYIITLTTKPVAFGCEGDACGTYSDSESMYSNIDLEKGMTHPSVITLQKYLNSNGYIIETVSGQSGSIGYESDYFGEKTKQALIKFQLDKGIYPAEGFFGSKTRSKMGI